MSKIQKNGFTDENIRKIFGSYDGEGENLNRLTEYYLKTDTYEATVASLPVKILVGSKGVGKSALFRIAIKEGRESGKICILIKPDDIAEIGEKHESLMISIRRWKYGLTKIIARKVLGEFGLYENENTSINPINFGGRVFPLITDLIDHLKDEEQLTHEQLGRINNFKKTNEIDVYLDDLDRGWQNRREGLIMISALINSIRDMSSENEGLYFKLAIRTDVYFAVRTEDESSDKFEGLVTYYTYKLHEIFVLLIKRVLTFRNEPVNEQSLLSSPQKHIAHHLESIFDMTFYGSGNWGNKPMYIVLLSLIRNRPRDLVKLCTMAAKQAYKTNSLLIRTAHIEAILPEYSKSIINDTIAEYKSELSSIDRLIYGMKPSRREKSAADVFFFTTIDLKQKLFKLTQMGEFRFASGTVASPQDLIGFLFKIGLLTARKTESGGNIVRKSYEDASNLSSAYLDFGFDWEVHMGYRWAIQPDTLEDIFSRL